MKLSFTLLLLFVLNSSSAQEKFQLFFDFNKDVINKTSVVDLDNWLGQSSKVTILKIEGYCDSVDTNNYNKILAARRVNTVLELLQSKGVQFDKKLVVKAIGENFEQAANQSQNRKVVLYYQSLKGKIENENLTTTKQQSGALQEEQTVAIAEDTSILEQLGKAKAGDLIPIKNLIFYFNSEKIVTESEAVLQSLLDALRANPLLKINIYGHICCNRNPNDVKLSYRRSKFVFDYLIKNGIATARLGHKGFGSSKPLYALPEKNEAERAANRRVEIFVVQK